MKGAVFTCIVLLALSISSVSAAGKPATKQPYAKEPLAKKARTGKGKCKSGRFVVLDKPLLPFSRAAAACSKIGKKLASIDAIYGGSDATVMVAAKVALSKCVGRNYQVWYDTSLTKADKPSVCTAFVETVGPTDGGASASSKSASATIILPTTVLGGCSTKLPVLCM